MMQQDARIKVTTIPGNKERKKERQQEKRKKEVWSGGKKRGLKIIVRLRTGRKRRKTVVSHRAGKGKNRRMEKLGNEIRKLGDRMKMRKRKKEKKKNA
jgi:hypothetical protein